MTYGDFKDLAKRTAADKVYQFIDKKLSGNGITTLANKSAVKSIPQNEQLAEELHKPINRKF